MPLNRYHAHSNDELIIAMENACFAICHKDTKKNQQELERIEAELRRRMSPNRKED